MYKFTVRLFWDECPGLGTIQSRKDLTVRADSIELAEKYSAVWHEIVGDGVRA